MRVHKNRLGARPPRKRSAPVAGKRIRNDETPPQAGFRISGVWHQGGGVGVVPRSTWPRSAWKWMRPFPGAGLSRSST